MLGSIVALDMVTELLEKFDKSNTAAAAYKAAWKKRELSGDTDPAHLFAELKNRSVEGAYAPLDDPRLAVPLELWRAGIEPREAKRSIKAGKILG